METVRWLNAFFELIVVAAFGLGWLVLEWVGRRLDRQRAERQQEDLQSSDVIWPSESASRHPEGEHGLDDP